MSYLLVFLLITSPTPKVPLRGVTPMILTQERVGSVLPNGAQFYSTGTCAQWARQAIKEAQFNRYIAPEAVFTYTYSCEQST